MTEQPRREATDARANEGLDHLQTAATELIAAARAFLDVAEDLVREPGALAAVLRAATTMTRPGRPPPTEDEPPDGGVEHIPLADP